MLPRGYITHEAVMASLPKERRKKIETKTRQLLRELEQRERCEKVLTKDQTESDSMDMQQATDATNSRNHDEP